MYFSWKWEYYWPLMAVGDIMRTHIPRTDKQQVPIVFMSLCPPLFFQTMMEHLWHIGDTEELRWVGLCFWKSWSSMKKTDISISKASSWGKLIVETSTRCFTNQIYLELALRAIGEGASPGNENSQKKESITSNHICSIACSHVCNPSASKESIITLLYKGGYWGLGGQESVLCSWSQFTGRDPFHIALDISSSEQSEAAS